MPKPHDPREIPPGPPYAPTQDPRVPDTLPGPVREPATSPPLEEPGVPWGPREAPPTQPPVPEREPPPGGPPLKF
ncbi:MAG: filamentous hemagglutinin [Pseudomonadota bacterium]|nr:filamentous hemagglutinin [Pseudomonadota bacterium]